MRERLYIQLKLFVVMGLPWMFEPISWAVDSSPSVTSALPFSTCWVWLVTDLVNMLQVSWLDLHCLISLIGCPSAGCLTKLL